MHMHGWFVPRQEYMRVLQQHLHGPFSLSVPLSLLCWQRGAHQQRLERATFNDSQESYWAGSTMCHLKSQMIEIRSFSHVSCAFFCMI